MLLVVRITLGFYLLVSFSTNEKPFHSEINIYSARWSRWEKPDLSALISVSYPQHLQGVIKWYIIVHTGDSTTLERWRSVKKCATKSILTGNWRSIFFLFFNVLTGRIKKSKVPFLVVHCFEQSLKHSSFDTLSRFQWVEHVTIKKLASEFQGISRNESSR